VLSWKRAPQIFAVFGSLKCGVKVLISEGTRTFKNKAVKLFAAHWNKRSCCCKQLTYLLIHNSKFLGQGMVYIKLKGYGQNNIYWYSEITMQFKLQFGVHSKPQGLCFLKNKLIIM
jgi:hypothetical protein